MSQTHEVIVNFWGPGRGRRPTMYPNRNRRDFAKLTNVLGFTYGAEIGVGSGHNSKMLCDRNPGLELLCVDTWAAYEAFPGAKGMTQAEMDIVFERAAYRLSKSKATLVRKDSVDAARNVSDGSLDFVYLDAGHRLPYVIADLAAWTPKVRSGGIVAGHDFTFNRWRAPLTRKEIGSGPAFRPCHVIDAVLAWTRCYRVSPWYVLDGQKATASWMWVQP